MIEVVPALTPLTGWARAAWGGEGWGQMVQLMRTGSGCRVTPKRAWTPSRISRARASRSAVRAVPLRLVRASVCLPEMATPPGPGWPLAKPALSISQAALTLTMPSGAGPGRRVAEVGGALPQQLVRRPVEHRVGEERADRAGVRVGGVEHHALAGAQPQHRVPGVGQRHPVADLDPERAGQLGVADRPGQRGAVQPEVDGEHHPAVAVLEDARPVGEPAVGRGDGGRPVPRPRSYASTPVIVSATSWPYAPTFWIGVAPAEPGMPERHSSPDQPLATVAATRSSQGSPASTRTVTVSASSATTAHPRERTSTTVPGKPASPITTLLPPARTSTGSSRRRASRTRRTISSALAAATTGRRGHRGAGWCISPGRTGIGGFGVRLSAGRRRLARLSP